LKIEDYFLSEYDIGVIRSKGSKARVFILASHAWATMEKELTEKLSKSAPIILRHIGKSYGQAIAHELTAPGRSREEQLDSLRSLAAAAGWGLVRIKGDTEHGKGMNVEVRQCVFCQHSVRMGDASCHFLGGVISGVVDGLYDIETRAVEVRCVCKGDDSCSFTMEAARNP
jgi:predicted hydrocarbon binding protein